MALSEAQLETWSQHGKTGQFTDTYQSIRGNLVDNSAPYPVKDVEVFLQGSYGNDTNVWADSDVDIVLKHNGAFYYDITGMNEPEQRAFKGNFSTDAVPRTAPPSTKLRTRILSVWSESSRTCAMR